MNTALEAKIYLKCPILYHYRKAGPQSNLMCFGFATGDGWYDIIYNASVEIEAIAQKMEQQGIEESYLPAAAQVKEKFGTLRFYVDNQTDEISDILDKVSATTCESCGQTGKLVTGDWLRTLCPSCEA